jgi:pimeloyl-ACP methyl ester carboxylesterase
MDRRNLLINTATLALGAGLAVGAAQLTPAAGAARVVAGAPVRVTAADGTQLFVRDLGQGAPVLFVHSWAFDSGMWDYQIMPLLDEGHRCVAYDRRGHGRSDAPSHGYDFDTLADDLASVIDALGLEHVTLVGHSMGCGEIVRYLTRHGGGKVARVVLLSPTMPYLLKTADNPDGIDGAMFEAVREMWRQDFPKWVDDNAAPFVVAETSPGMRDWLRQMMLRASLPVLIACNRSLVETDFRAELARLDVPVLLIHGDHDASAPLPLTGARTAALIPHVDFRLYEGAPHGLFVTHMARVNADILSFLGA